MRRRLRWLVVVGALGAGALLLSTFISVPIIVSEGYQPIGSPFNHPVSKIVRDDRPAFHLDPGEPWQIEFGRGSGWHGLDTAKLDQGGRVTFHRLSVERRRNVDVLSWETATARLPPDAVAKVLRAVEANGLLGLDKAYHAAVYDGTQWILWVRQSGREKAVYFDNHFPDSIVRFAEQFDAIVSESVGPGLKWRAVPPVWARDHERDLWDSIKR